MLYVYRILSSINRCGDRLIMKSSEFDYDRTFSAFVILRVTYRSKKLSISFRLSIKNDNADSSEFLYDYEFESNTFVCMTYIRSTHRNLACNLKLKYKDNLTQRDMMMLLWKNRFSQLNGFSAVRTAVHGEKGCSTAEGTSHYNQLCVNKKWKKEEHDNLLVKFVFDKFGVQINLKDESFMKDFLSYPMNSINSINESQRVLIQTRKRTNSETQQSSANQHKRAKLV